MNPQDATWSRRLTTAVGQRLRVARTHEGISAQELAERTRLLGHEVKRALIADMENGRRPLLPIADLLVLSAALNLPPLMLLFPPIAESEHEVLPGTLVSGSDAIDWLDGTSPLGTGRQPWSHPLDDDGDAADWKARAKPLISRHRFRGWAAEAQAAARKLERLLDEAEASTGVARRFYFDRLDGPATELHDLLVDIQINDEIAREQGHDLPEIDLPNQEVWSRMRALRESLAEENSEGREVG